MTDNKRQPMGGYQTNIEKNLQTLREMKINEWLYQICEKYRPDIVNFSEPRAVMMATLKAVGEWLEQPCPHMEGRIRRVCYRCLNELLQALKEGRMP